MLDDIRTDAERRMKKSIDIVTTDLERIRTGRATPALLDQVKVDYYGSVVPINQAATVGVGDARTLTVQAWEKNMIPVIEKAILESNLGLNPVSAGEIIRIPLPALTEERRREMTKLVRKEGERGKVALRNIRRDGNQQLRDFCKEKEITEDDVKKGETKLQELTDQHVDVIDALVSAKESEVMAV